MWDYIYRDRIGILAGECGAPLIVIQSGAEGIFNRYEDKYLRLAQKLNTRGYNVISSSNLGNKHFKTTMEFAQKMMMSCSAPQRCAIWAAPLVRSKVYNTRPSPLPFKK